jgi:hypothetical protein
MKTYQPTVNPRRGVDVHLTTKPGTWQILDKSPRRGGWWLLAIDDEAKATGDYAEAIATEMTTPNER